MSDSKIPAISNDEAVFSEEEYDSSEETYDYSEEEYNYDEEEFYSSENYYVDNGKTRSLVPSKFNDVETALKQFDAVFNQRYCKGHLSFSQVPLKTTFNQALDTSDINARKPLVLYLHSDHSVIANIFATKIFGDDKIASLLNEKFALFGWDCTRDENIELIINWLDDVHANGIKALVEDTWADCYPLMMVVQKDRGVISTVANIRNHDDLDVVHQKLMEAAERFETIKSRQAVEARSRAEREQLKAEQEAAYELSKEQDRVRMETKAQLAREEREAEEARIRKEAADKALQEELMATLPKEPAANDEGIITIRLRFPDNNLEIRRFFRTDPLKLLVHFAGSRGYLSGDYTIFTSDFPRKNVANLDMESSFDDLKWSPREQVIVEEL